MFGHGMQHEFSEHEEVSFVFVFEFQLTPHQFLVSNYFIIFGMCPLNNNIGQDRNNQQYK